MPGTNDKINDFMRANNDGFSHSENSALIANNDDENFLPDAAKAQKYNVDSGDSGDIEMYRALKQIMFLVMRLPLFICAMGAIVYISLYAIPYFLGIIRRLLVLMMS